jgi:hypothetical protein
VLDNHHLSLNAPLKVFFGSFFPKNREFGAYECDGDNPAFLLTIMSKTDERSKKHEVVFFIDKQQFKSEDPDLSVRTLLVDLAKEDPNQTTLASKHGNDLTKYANLDEVIHIENWMKFIVLHNSPTPVT